MGDLEDRLIEAEQGMPRSGSEGYVRPNADERKAFVNLVSYLQTGDMAAAAALAEQTDYTVIRYVDLGDENAVSLLLREIKPITRGWGFYALREPPVNNIIVEAPHPLSDPRSDIVALDLYRALDARAFLLPGAYRDANENGEADVAHASRSIFQSVHETLISNAQEGSDPTVILQIHGFANDKHPGYPSVIIGTRDIPSPGEISLSREIADALSARGISVELCSRDAWQDLCGTKNVQASTAGKAIFIHLELSETLRSNDRVLLDALKQVLIK